MHFDPYESKTAKRKRIISNTVITLIIVSMIIAIGSLILRRGGASVEPYLFPKITITQKDLKSTEKDVNPFEKLYQYAVDKKTFSLDDTFRLRYSDAAKLILMEPSVYHSDRPYVRTAGNTIAVAQCFISENTDWRELEILLLPVDYRQNNSQTKFKLSHPQAFTIKYNARDGSLLYTPFLSDTFRLDLFTLGVQMPTEAVVSASYSFAYTTQIPDNTIKAEALHQVVFNPAQVTYHQPQWKTERNATVVGAEIDADQIDRTQQNFALQMKVPHDYLGMIGTFEVTWQTLQKMPLTIMLN